MADDLERRAIIAAHDAECHCGDVPSISLLTEREQAIVEAWRADAERHTIVTGIADKQGARILGERNEALAAIERVRLICAEYADAPPPSEPEVCDDADEGYCHYDAHRSVADRIRRAIDEPEATP